MGQAGGHEGQYPAHSRARAAPSSRPPSAAALGRSLPARADDGDNLVLGQGNAADQGTSLTNTTANSSHALNAIGSGATGGIGAESSSGIAVEAYSVTGLGLRVASGRVRLDQASGVATIKAGTSSRTISPGFDINLATFVLLTPMSNLAGRSLWFTKNASTDTIALHMSSARSSTTMVAWLALEKGGWGPEPKRR